MQGFATVASRLWRYTGDGTGSDRSDPAALTEYDWSSGDEVGWTQPLGVGSPAGPRVQGPRLIKIIAR